MALNMVGDGSGAAAVMKTRIRLTIVLAAAIAVLTACTPDSSKPMRVGTNLWLGYEPLYIADELGAWPEKQIHLAQYPSASEVIRAFRNNALDAAALTLDEALLLRQDNIPVKIVLVMDISRGADVILARPPVNSVAALQGKRVGVESTALGAFVITRALELHNMQLPDINIVSLDVNRHEQAYLDNKIDAVVTFEPVRTRLLGAGANQIFSSRDIPGEIVDVLVVHQDYINKHPGKVKRLTSGWFKAVDYIKDNMQQAAEIIAPHQQLTPREVLDGYKGLLLADKEKNRALLSNNPPRLQITINKMQKILLKHHLLEPGTGNSNLISNRFIDQQ